MQLRLPQRNASALVAVAASTRLRRLVAVAVGVVVISAAVGFTTRASARGVVARSACAVTTRAADGTAGAADASDATPPWNVAAIVGATRCRIRSVG
jgi:hypothetical protein